MKKKTIWICDDDVDILEICSLILRKKNYEVKTLTNCESMFEKIDQSRPDAILLDLWIPEMGGEEATYRLKANERTRDIPVILFSAHNELEAITERTKADGFVKKPFEVDELIAVMEKATATAEGS